MIKINRTERTPTTTQVEAKKATTTNKSAAVITPAPRTPSNIIQRLIQARRH